MEKANNKGRRHELKMLKLKGRLKNYGLTNSSGNIHAFRTTGKPCSCYMCSKSKITENGLKKKDFKEFQYQIKNSLVLNS